MSAAKYQRNQPGEDKLRPGPAPSQPSSWCTPAAPGSQRMNCAIITRTQCSHVRPRKIQRARRMSQGDLTQQCHPGQPTKQPLRRVGRVLTARTLYISRRLSVPCNHGLTIAIWLGQLFLPKRGGLTTSSAAVLRTCFDLQKHG